MDLPDRIRTRIAARQNKPEDEISISMAAREIGCAETTLRSTLKGHLPSSVNYWRQLRAYCATSLDWLICGIGSAPPLDGRARMLLIGHDPHITALIHRVVDNCRIDRAMSAREATNMCFDETFDLIIISPDVKWTDREINSMSRLAKRPRLIALGDKNNTCDVADEICREINIDSLSRIIDEQLEILGLNKEDN